MTRTTGLLVRRRGVVAAVVALMALSGAACRLVQPPGVEPQDPTGGLELVEGGEGQVRVAGWATQYPPAGDNGQQRTTQIVVLVEGQWAPGAVPADDPRPDIEAVLVATGLLQFRQPDMGYGFDVTKPAPEGDVTVCVIALNQFIAEWGPYGAWGGSGPPEHVLLGCRTVEVT